jgi:hypothetical protein
VAFLYKSQPRHSCAAALSARTLVVSGTNGAADPVPPASASDFFATFLA